jgi:hypothetical protein
LSRDNWRQGLDRVRTPIRSQLIKRPFHGGLLASPKFTGTRKIAASKQAGGSGDRSEAFGAYGTQDRKPKSLKQIQVAENMVPSIFRSI